MFSNCSGVTASWRQTIPGMALRPDNRSLSHFAMLDLRIREEITPLAIRIKIKSYYEWH